jgi:hypothetical protein
VIRRAELTIAVIAALASIPPTYAAQRLFDVMFHAQPNPATVISSAMIAMFWRVKISAFFAPAVGMLVLAIARRDLARTVERVYVGACIGAAFATAQAIFAP